ncbi:DNA-binding protein [Companilactobacillus sp. RD055328]|uniref:NYN domain-containing protein n=1 Tax=Companilactobacillus sp. RD055328 TaxID=2916634 RepID=UPI001FC7CC3C|nr:NYN domain-containing protein [Companilactobacillus sp. RD055328]GKQ42171.1 DNA-binding protein [Companilactobacillus sp. RD055328]
MAKKQIIIVDGYNVIGSWPNLSKLKNQNHLSQARDELLHVLAEYRKIEDVRMIVVFDAMYVPGVKETFNVFDLEVVFTPEDQTADSYIEALSGELNSPLNTVTVVTSDQAEQWTIFSRGAYRIPSSEFKTRIDNVKKEIDVDVKKHYDRQITRNSPWSDEQLLQLKEMMNKKDQS